jgi:hypothetical protein
MNEAVGLKLLHRSPLEWHYLRTKFHENLPSCSKVINGGHTESHFGMIKVTFNAITTSTSKSTNRLIRCTHLRSLNVRHYRTVEAMRLKNKSSRSPSMSSPPHKKKCHRNPPVSSKVIKGFLYTHLRSLNVRHIEIPEAKILENVASRSLTMVSPAYQISWKSRKSTSGFKGVSGGHTDRQTDRHA